MNLIFHQDYIKGREGEPIAIKTVLGWIFVGSSENINGVLKKCKNNSTVHCNLTTSLDGLN